MKEINQYHKKERLFLNDDLIMLDTNICIYVMKNRPQIAKQYFSCHSHQLCISSVVMMELLYSTEKSEFVNKNLLAVYDFTSHIPIVDFDVRASAHTANIKATLKNKVHQSGLMM